MSRLILFTLGFSFCVSASGTATAEKYLPAKWRQELSSTTLVGDKPGEYRVRSNISTGTDGVDAVIRYSLAVKIETWGKPFTATEDYDFKGKRYKQTLKVTLTPAASAKELNADFEHTVAEDGKVILRFAGNTILHHWQGK